jgi:hypothetical protein
MKYDVVTSHIYIQHWTVEAESKDKAEEIFINVGLDWDKKRRQYVLKKSHDKIQEGLVVIPDAELRAVMPMPGQTEPSFTKLGESNE